MIWLCQNWSCKVRNQKGGGLDFSQEERKVLRCAKRCVAHLDKGMGVTPQQLPPLLSFNFRVRMLLEPSPLWVCAAGLWMFWHLLYVNMALTTDVHRCRCWRRYHPWMDGGLLIGLDCGMRLGIGVNLVEVHLLSECGVIYNNCSCNTENSVECRWASC